MKPRYPLARHPLALLRPTLVLTAALAALAGCANGDPKPPSMALDHTPRTLQVAASNGAAQLLARARVQRNAPGFWAGWFPGRVIVDTTVDDATGGQTAATRAVQQALAAAVAGNRAGDFLAWPLQADLVPSADYRLSSRLMAKPGTPEAVLELSLVDLRNASTVARNRLAVLREGLDTTPTLLTRESPVTPSSRTTAASAASAATAPATTMRPDGERQRTLARARLMAASAAFEAGSLAEAMAGFRAAASTEGVAVTDAEAAHVGVYLSAARLGQQAVAASAFARVVAIGMDQRALGLKLLFAPGSVDYWADPAVSKPYPGWLSEIASQAAARRACLQVVGHSSRTGSVDFNDRLSEQRASAVAGQLTAAQPALAGTRLAPSGMGFRENLVGTGSDDARDAVDRRVEFRVVDCR